MHKHTQLCVPQDERETYYVGIVSVVLYYNAISLLLDTNFLAYRSNSATIYCDYCTSVAKYTEKITSTIMHLCKHV
jgi:hypothetical protein